MISKTEFYQAMSILVIFITVCFAMLGLKIELEVKALSHQTEEKPQ